MELQSQRLIIREFRQSDYEAVREYENNLEIHRYEKEVIPTEAATQAYIEEALTWSQENPRTHYRLAITLPPGDIVRGRVSLSLNFSEIREWEIGWTLHFGYWGKGYASEAAKTMLAFAFEELQAHRVVAFCNVLNKRSEGVMKKIGMQQDGRLRETRWWNGGWMDEYVYAILDKDWNGKR